MCESIVRCPATILVDCQADIALLGQLDQPQSHVDIGDEGLLTEDVFAGQQAVANDRRSIRRMGSDIHDLNPVQTQQVAVIVKHLGIGIKLLSPLPRTVDLDVAHGRHFPTRLTIGGQVFHGNAATANQTDRRAVRNR